MLMPFTKPGAGGGAVHRLDHGMRIGVMRHVADTGHPQQVGIEVQRLLGLSAPDPHVLIGLALRRLGKGFRQRPRRRWRWSGHPR